MKKVIKLGDKRVSKEDDLVALGYSLANFVEEFDAEATSEELDGILADPNLNEIYSNIVRTALEYKAKCKERWKGGLEQ